MFHQNSSTNHFSQPTRNQVRNHFSNPSDEDDLEMSFEETTFSNHQNHYQQEETQSQPTQSVQDYVIEQALIKYFSSSGQSARSNGAHHDVALNCSSIMPQNGNVFTAGITNHGNSGFQHTNNFSNCSPTLSSGSKNNTDQVDLNMMNQSTNMSSSLPNNSLNSSKNQQFPNSNHFLNPPFQVNFDYKVSTTSTPNHSDNNQTNVQMIIPNSNTNNSTYSSIGQVLQLFMNTQSNNPAPQDHSMNIQLPNNTGLFSNFGNSSPQLTMLNNGMNHSTFATSVGVQSTYTQAQQPTSQSPPSHNNRFIQIPTVNISPNNQQQPTLNITQPIQQPTISLSIGSGLSPENRILNSQSSLLTVGSSIMNSGSSLSPNSTLSTSPLSNVGLQQLSTSTGKQTRSRNSSTGSSSSISIPYQIQNNFNQPLEGSPKKRKIKFQAELNQAQQFDMNHTSFTPNTMRQQIASRDERERNGVKKRGRPKGSSTRFQMTRGDVVIYKNCYESVEDLYKDGEQPPEQQ